ncbi:MAG: Crp/Fnr family transcriptional regulator [Sphingomonadales bacterium]
MIRSRPLPETCADCKTCAKVEWSRLAPTAIKALAPERQSGIYHAGQTVFHQQDDPLGIYCIEAGTVLLHHFDVHGTETVFRIIYEGQTMGWRSFFAREPHSANCMAVTDCRICLIPGATVEQMVRDIPDMAREFLQTVARDRGPRDAMMLRGPGLSARVRLLNLLIVLKDHCSVASGGNGLELKLPLQRQTLAAMLGIRSETLSRTIKELEAEGLANFTGQSVVIPDFSRLDRAVNGG